ncbi:MAG: acyl carrier protein, partial [Vicinamibacterales bacterium]
MSHPTPSPDDHAALERHILQLVGQLVGELRPGSAAAGIGPDDSLERELGIGSLERVELLTRIERGVGVRLADSVMAAADTPADLVRAVVASEPAVAETLPSV